VVGSWWGLPEPAAQVSPEWLPAVGTPLLLSAWEG
jgi:hypothetical protein